MFYFKVKKKFFTDIIDQNEGFLAGINKKQLEIPIFLSHMSTNKDKNL